MKEIYKIISLDVSSTCTGYSTFELDLTSKTFKHIKTDSIKSSKKSLYDRFNFIDNYFINNKLYSSFDLVVFENYAFNGNRVTQLAELNGVIKYKYYLNNTSIEVIAPNSIKKYVTGSGKSKKDIVRQSLKDNSLFKDIKFKNNDESDSLAVGYAYILKKLEES